MRRPARRSLALALAAVVGLAGAEAAGADPRPWPDTTRGVHVFNDQLTPWMTDAQAAFAATHYAGSQKLTRSLADRLRGHNPAFLVLHYRLGAGLGYRPTSGGCSPSDDWIRIVDGDAWVPEWPGDDVVAASWFFPYAGQARVLMCAWGWYLMDLDDPGYRSWWAGEVAGQLQRNDDDGVFLDSLSVPNYLGADLFSPALAAYDPTFEAAWAGRIRRWLEWMQTTAVGGYHVVPNVGAWITTRDPTDYSGVDGVMVEGFAQWGDDSPFDPSDWALQVDRVLRLVRSGKAVLAQSYASGTRGRLFALGTYLLVKGSRAFLNSELDLEPEWWPEYDVPIGAPLTGPAASAAAMYDAGAGVYRRAFDNGEVLVNPSGTTREVALGRTRRLLEVSGGGTLPASGVPTGTLSYRLVTHVTLPPQSGAVLLDGDGTSPDPRTPPPAPPGPPTPPPSAAPPPPAPPCLRHGRLKTCRRRAPRRGRRVRRVRRARRPGRR